MRLLWTIAWVLPRRFKSTWLLFCITSFGVLASVTLMSLGPLYSQALSEGGLRHTFALNSPSTLNAQIEIRNRPIGPVDYNSLNKVVKEKYNENIGPIINNIHRSGKLLPNSPISPIVDGKYPMQSAPKAQLFFLTEFEMHSKLIAGRWAMPTYISKEKGLDIEIVAGEKVASAMGWSINQKNYVIPFKSDPLENISFTLVGIVEPVDTKDEYWMTSANGYFETQELGNNTVVPMYISEEKFFNGIGERYPSLLSDYSWNIFIDTNAISSKSADHTKKSLDILEQQLNKTFPRTLLFTRLGEVIESYQRELNLSKVPLFLFLSLVVVVIMYFLILILGILSQAHSETANIFRSRGANTLQVTSLLAAGECLIVIASVLVGPIIALAIVKLLLVKTIDPYGGIENIPVELSPDVFLIGSIGGILSTIVLISSSFNLSKHDMVDFLRSRSRPPTIPLLHRYYLDLLLITLIAIIWWQIEDQQGFFRKNLTDNTITSVDTSMLMGPVLIVLCAAFMIPRFLPPIMNFFAWISRSFGPSWASLTLTTMSRDPLKHGALVIMLMMVTALGVFGASFQSTLSQSVEDRILFSIGGDLVIRSAQNTKILENQLKYTPGIAETSRITKTAGGINAVDSTTLHNTAWFRDDFAGKNLKDLLRAIPNSQTNDNGISIPKETEQIGLWVKISDTNQTMATRKLHLKFRIQDAYGDYHNMDAGDIRFQIPGLENEDWIYLQASLPTNLSSMNNPMKIVAVFLQGQYATSLSKSQTGVLAIDEITAIGPNIPNQVLIVEDFEYESTNSWISMPNMDSVSDKALINKNSSHSGKSSLEFHWFGDISEIPRGIISPSIEVPLNAIGNSSTTVGQTMLIRSNNQIVPIIIRDKTDFFPSESASSLFTIISLKDYERYLDRLPAFDSTNNQNELWISVDESFNRESVIESIKEISGSSDIVDSEAFLNIGLRNPLAGGGWNGLTILSMTVLTVAVAVALFTSSLVSVRDARLDFSIAKTLGLSKAETVLSIVLERIFLAVTGILSGSVIGIVLSNWVLSFLDINADGSSFIPPMLVTLNGSIARFVYLDLTIAVFISLTLGSIYALRLNAAYILRNGGE